MSPDNEKFLEQGWALVAKKLDATDDQKVLFRRIYYVGCCAVLETLLGPDLEPRLEVLKLAQLVDEMKAYEASQPPPT